ncbi:MAG: radical SAM family heme chaperone HemW [Flavobacteriales bacterium]|nr:radical SAM family heme chaperone HemW [Flavobacteriales bacterium]MBL6868851.1 radical SAM family heme chaperone HemW [Flavobacteriales bacterium]
MSGIYIHIPYCKQACHYCDFHFSTSMKTKNEMIDCIVKEMDIRESEFSKKIDSLYIGGGTPSLMTNLELETIFNGLEKKISIGDIKEITIEINPEDLISEKLEFYKEIGINRLSIGIQSMNNNILKWMNRSHDTNQVINGLNNTKVAGFENINLDFIYGTPKNLSRDYKSELLEILKFNPTHLSCYHLTIEDGTYFGHLEKNKKIKRIEDDISQQEFRWISEKLKSKNYQHYEISNFAVQGKESFHNSNYWNQSSYIGLGPGAHSFRNSTRRWNISNNRLYIKNIKAGIPYFEQEVLSPYDIVNEKIMLGLRTLNGLDKDHVFSIVPKAIKEGIESKLNTFLKDEILLSTNNIISMNPEKWLLSEYVSRELFILKE